MENIHLFDLPGQYKLIEKEVLSSIENVLESGRYILGPKVTNFENNFTKFCDAHYCIGTSSGTEALVLSLIALGIGKGDEVITVPNTFTATVEAIAWSGAKPVFCDVDRQTMNMDPNLLGDKLTKRTRAVIPVHLHGNPADVDEIYKITKPRGIFVIEDAAQALGSKYKQRNIGSLASEFTCFSFHPVKTLGAYGDAGAIVTNKERLANKVRLLINHGKKDNGKHVLVGTTARLDALQATILNLKLKYLGRWIENKKRLVDQYKNKLENVCEFIKVTKNSENSYHVFTILVKRRNELINFLADNAVETAIFYPIPLHLQPAYKALGYKKGDFPISEMYASKTLSLPLFPHMTESQVNYISEKIKEFLNLKERV